LNFLIFVTSAVWSRLFWHVACKFLFNFLGGTHVANNCGRVQ